MRLDGLAAEEEVFECDCLLNATGRVPNVFGIGLDEAGVDYNNRQGVVIDDFFRFVMVQHLSYTTGVFHILCLRWR